MDLTEYFEAFTARDWQEDVGGDPVRFAMIGLGWWVREEAIPAVENSSFCETAVTVSSSPEKAERVAEAADAEAAITYEAFHEGAAAEHYDAVYVCTPNATHLDFVETAAELGKDVLCEKPMEASVDRAEDLVAACEDAGVTLMVAYRMQTEPAVRRARDLVREGFVGEPIQVHSHMSDDLLSHVPDHDQWRLTPELSGGTTMNDIGIYSINTARFVLGDDPTAVYATQRSEREAFAGVDEHVAFQLEFEGGPTAACTASHNAERASELRVIGSEGQVVVDPIYFPWDDREVLVQRDGVRSRVTFEQIDQMEEEFDYFANCLQRGNEPHPDGHHGLVDLRTIEALYESAERGERVTL
ncbi:MAG: D-xylose 1-dehydrogenase Gfo6 [Halobacteriales archaeon]